MEPVRMKATTKAPTDLHGGRAPAQAEPGDPPPRGLFLPIPQVPPRQPAATQYVAPPQEGTLVTGFFAHLGPQPTDIGSGHPAVSRAFDLRRHSSDSAVHPHHRGELPPIRRFWDEAKVYTVVRESVPEYRTRAAEIEKMVDAAQRVNTPANWPGNSKKKSTAARMGSGIDSDARWTTRTAH